MLKQHGLTSQFWPSVELEDAMLKEVDEAA